MSNEKPELSKETIKEFCHKIIELEHEYGLSVTAKKKERSAVITITEFESGYEHDWTE